MDKVQALFKLGFSPDDRTPERESLFENYEEAVFEQATFFMRRPFIPKLALKRISILKDLDRALEAFTPTIDIPQAELTQSIDLDKIRKSLSIKDLVLLYSAWEGELKLKLSNAVAAPSAIKAYETWLVLHEIYASRFIQLGQGMEVDRSVAISENIQAIDLITELNHSKSGNQVQREYSRLTKIYAKS